MSTPVVAIAPPSLVSPAPRVFLRLMGDLSLVVDGVDRSALLKYEKVRVLLAVLALAQSQSVSRAKLAGMIWPDVDISEGRARVRHALHTLKQVFSALPEALEVSTTHIRLCPDLVQVDALSLVQDPSTPFQIDDAQRVEWYRSPVLGVCSTPLSDEFDSWLQGWVARIEIAMTQCRQRIIDFHLQADDQATALAHATRWAERWPEDESCHRMLIRLLVATGQHDAAMLAYEHCSRVLLDRLGLAPSSETRALLGIEAVAPNSVQVRPHLYKREFRPISVVAVTLSWQSSRRDLENVLEAMSVATSAVTSVVQQSGAWICPSSGHGNTLLAYFGYPGLTEYPINHAIALSQTLSALTLPEGVCLGMGLHADVTLIEPEKQSPDASALMSQEVLPLSWHARHRETLLSQPAVQRLPPSCVLTLRRAGQTNYVLEHHPQSEVNPRLHGRAREFDFLVGQWMRQQPGRLPSMVTVTGFAGVGKSLLVNAIAEYALQSGGQRIMLQCEEAHAHLPFYPVLSWLRQQFDALMVRLRDVGQEEAFERFCDFLGLKGAESEEFAWVFTSAQIHESQQAQAYDILGAILARCALNPQQPRLVVIENLHWADHATLNLLQKIKEKPTRLPLMLLATSRVSVLNGMEQTLPLGPLEDVHMAQLVSHRSRTFKLTKKQRQHVLEHCHGVPLYAVLLMRQTTHDLPLEYSCSLTDTLCVALHRLPPAALELIQLSALMGETLDFYSLGAILSMNNTVLEEATSVLLEHGFLIRDSRGGLVRVILVQLAIKRMTPRKTRQRLHTLIVRHFISLDVSPVVIAPHAEAADESSTPMWWQRAAVHEIREKQPKRARMSLERALKHSHRIDAHEARRQFEFECQVLLGELAVVTAGPGSEQTLQAYEAVNRLLPSDEPNVALVNLWGKWLSLQHTGRYTEALDVARRHMRLAIEQKSNLAKGWSHYALGQTYLWCGQLSEAEHELDQCIAILNTVPPNDDLVSLYGEHAHALVYATQALCMALRGRSELALTLSQMAMQQSMTGGSPATIVACLLLTARIHYLLNSAEVAAMMCQEMLAHMPADGTLGPWHSIMHAFASLPAVLEGRCAASLQQLHDMLPVIEAGLPTLLNSWLCLIARGLIAEQSFEEAALMLNKADDINRDQGSTTLEPEIYCLRGDLCQASGQLLQAHKAWELARASAQRHGLLVYLAWLDQRLMQFPIER
jgi:DNA-binding SARP family transcriptional activator/tetratricopeptide (TPR) repeat protein